MLNVPPLWLALYVQKRVAVRRPPHLAARGGILQHYEQPIRPRGVAVDVVSGGHKRLMDEREACD